MRTHFRSPHLVSPRIAILSPVWKTPNFYGGITPVVKLLTEGFCLNGARVALLSHYPIPFPFEGCENLDVVPILKKHKIQNIVAIHLFLKKFKPDLLLTAGHTYNKIGIFTKLLFREKWKLFLSIHCSILSEELGSLRQKKRIQFVRLFYPTAEGIICVSKGIEKELKREIGITKANITTIYNPVLPWSSLVKSENNDKIEELPHWIKQKTEPIIIGVGRLTEQKDFHSLIRAFALVRKNRRCKLVILGEGEDRESLESLIKELSLEEDVFLPGFKAEVMDYMKRADVFVLSSKWEGMSLVIVEALSIGLPVVSTDCPHGPRELLQNGKYGILVPVGDVEKMARGIEKQLDSPPPKELLLKRSQEFFRDKVAKKYLNFFGYAINDEEEKN